MSVEDICFDQSSTGFALRLAANFRTSHDQTGSVADVLHWVTLDPGET